MLSEEIKSALVVAAHPDDEVLGCGGTMAVLARHGVRVQTAFVADGVGARSDAGAAVKELRQRREAAERANRLLGAEVIHYGDLPDNRLDTVPLLDVVKAVGELVERSRPQLVLTHHAGDLNVDHRVVHEAVLTACRPQPSRQVRGLLFFEVPSSTEWRAGGGPVFNPTWFSDISATLEIKNRALQAYGQEMRIWPHARSYEAVEHLARWRGASVGLEAAEAFMLGRWMWMS